MSETSSHAMKGTEFVVGVARTVLAGWGTRLALAWIGVLMLLALFAPLLANSHPLLLSEGGRLSSPLAEHLSPVDVVCLLGALSVLVLYVIGLSLRFKGVILLTVLLGGMLLSELLISLPGITVYEQYREREAAGAYDWVIRAPVPYSPMDYMRDVRARGLEAPLATPGHRHWLGTDENGADVLSRVIHAARLALVIGFIATGIAMALGVLIGALMGYFAGLVDILGMRLIEIFEAIPTLFLLLTFVAFFERSLYLIMVIIGLTSWPGFARYARAEYLKLRGLDYIQAARASGIPLPSILFRHMLPNALAPILVTASFSVASAILAEAVLSFLGLGLVDEPSWGQMLNQAVRSSSFNWWLAVFPGGAIFLTVFAYNLLGEALRDALDPHLGAKPK